MSSSEQKKAQPKTTSGNPLRSPPVSATFGNPGRFMKYLARVDGVLLFADLGTIDFISGGGNRCRTEIFNWVLDSEYGVVWIGSGNPCLFPEAPEKPHTGEALRLHQGAFAILAYMKTMKSVWAVIAGFLAVFILSIATDAALEAAGMLALPMTTGSLILALAYRSAFSIIGGWITAKIAPEIKIKRVRVLAILGTIGGIIGVFAGWNLSDHWYPIALAVTAYPLVMLGGKWGIKTGKV